MKQAQSKLSDAKVAEVTQDLRSENAELHKRLEVLKSRCAMCGS